MGSKLAKSQSQQAEPQQQRPQAKPTRNSSGDQLSAAAKALPTNPPAAKAAAKESKASKPGRK
jgi:hypothetical protein